MSNVMKELKAEIARLARRELHRGLAPIKRVNAAQRGWLAGLRRQITALQNELKNLRRVGRGAVPLAVSAAGADGSESRGAFWITGAGVRSLRKRLGLTQVEFARLANVSGQTVVNWEKTQGKIPIRRKETGPRLKEIRGMNKRSVKALLAPASKAQPK